MIIILFKVLSREQVVQQTPLEKSDETLVTNTNNGVSLTTMMKTSKKKGKNSMPLTAGKHRRSKNRNRQTMPRQRQHHKGRSNSRQCDSQRHSPNRQWRSKPTTTIAKIRPTTDGDNGEDRQSGTRRKTVKEMIYRAVSTQTERYPCAEPPISVICGNSIILCSKRKS